ncbi:hypothetical protein QBC34DRAFT_418362 [Podospora aff. communis PSN243]|uniref:Secreted protein n=1 Tax=Podospora aff. communis PSN243 TaxID=3040156 RepID=A0AAV9G1F9_9PEZI|nr:hypothetical protein QBC34DRAFT_418362 [Podospora aff. communis PSN243]
MCRGTAKVRRVLVIWWGLLLRTKSLAWPGVQVTGPGPLLRSWMPQTRGWFSMGAKEGVRGCCWWAVAGEEKGRRRRRREERRGCMMVCLLRKWVRYLRRRRWFVTDMCPWWRTEEGASRIGRLADAKYMCKSSSAGDCSCSQQTAELPIHHNQ